MQSQGPGGGTYIDAKLGPTPKCESIGAVFLFLCFVAPA